MPTSNKDESEQLTQLIEDLSIKNDSVKDSLMRCTACGKEGDGGHIRLAQRKRDGDLFKFLKIL